MRPVQKPQDALGTVICAVRCESYYTKDPAMLQGVLIHNISIANNIIMQRQLP